MLSNLLNQRKTLLRSNLLQSVFAFHLHDHILQLLCDTYSAALCQTRQLSIRCRVRILCAAPHGSH